MIENIIIESSAWRETDANTLFGGEPVFFSDANELSVLMRDLGIYESGSAARRAGRKGSIPHGFTEFKASKRKRIWIWNPTE